MRAGWLEQGPERRAGIGGVDLRGVCSSTGGLRRGRGVFAARVWPAAPLQPSAQPRSSLRHSPTGRGGRRCLGPAGGAAGRGGGGGSAAQGSGGLRASRCALPAAARVLSGRARFTGFHSAAGSPSCPSALPARRRPRRGAAPATLGCHGDGPAVIDGSDRQSAPCSANPPPRRPLQGCLTEELPVPACCARETRRRRDSGARGMMGSVGDRRRQSPLQPGHPRTPAQTSPRCLSAGQCRGRLQLGFRGFHVVC